MNEIVETVAKIGGGAFGFYFGQWLISYIKNKTSDNKVNGNTVCKDHSELAKTTIENNTILKSIREENRAARTMARDERNKLFEKADELEKDLSSVKTDVAVLGTKVNIIENTDDIKSKEIINKQFLVLDDQVAVPTCKTIESYFSGFSDCRPVYKIDDAISALKQQEYDFCIIDYCLNDSQNGFEFADYCEKAYPNMICIVYSGKKPKFIPTKYKDRYIDKPFNRNEFIEIINRFI